MTAMAHSDVGQELGALSQTDRHSLLLALAEVISPSLNGASSHRLAQSLENIVRDRSRPAPSDEVDLEWLTEALSRTPEERVAYWGDKLLRLADAGISMVDPLDDDYPANLRMVHNRPPFLMVRGSLLVEDVRAMAVVGTRRPSATGTESARSISKGLAARGVTVVSGLAAGIDTAAHEGALEEGGRTIAVFGTGIERVYPAANRELASRITRSGACVSQFWPSMGGARWSFPVRNLVTSGLSIGTIVVEAGETSGARLQALAALDHGKRVLLLRRLVEDQPWASAVAVRPGVMVFESVDEVIEAVDSELRLDAAVVG